MGLTSFIFAQNRQADPAPTPEPPENNAWAYLDGLIDLPGLQVLADSGTPTSQTAQTYAPRMLYHPATGKTHFCYMQREDGLPHGQAMLMTFDPDKGFDVARIVGSVMIPFSGAMGDTHTVPSMIIIKDPTDDVEKVYITQERTHLTPFDVIKDHYGDQSYWTEPFDIGVNLAYAHPLIKSNGHAVIWCRGGDIAGDANHLYSAYVVDSSNYFEGLNGATPRKISLKEGVGLWHYPGVPFGYGMVNGRHCVTIARRTGTGVEGSYQADTFSESYRLYTEDFITFTNKSGSYSHNTSGANYITAAQLRANFLIYSTGDIDDQCKPLICGQSSTGIFCAIHQESQFTGNYLFLYETAPDVFAQKQINIGNMTSWGATSPTSNFNYLSIFSATDIRVLVDLTIDGVQVQHWFQTTNMGDSWENLGNVRPAGETRAVRMLIPNNVMEIPDDTNFPVYFSYVDSVYTDGRGLVCRVAAWGTPQAIPEVSVTPAVSMNYNSTGLFHYKCDSANLVKSGNNVTSMTDLFLLRNCACANNPQWNGSNAVAFLAASSQKGTPSTPSTLINKTSLTFIFVGPFVAASHVLSFTNTANTNSYLSFRLFAANTFGTHPATAGIQMDKSTTVDAISVYGQDDISSGDHVIAWVLDGRAVPEIFIDGKKQYFQGNNADVIAEWESFGKGPAHLTTAANTVTIAGRDRSTDDYFNTTVKEMVLFSAVMPTVELQSRIKKLCDDYGITYQHQYQTP